MLKLRMEIMIRMMDGMRVGFPPVWLWMKGTLGQTSTMQKDENLIVVSVFWCVRVSRGMVGVPAKPNNPRRDKAQPQTWEDNLIKENENEEWRKHSLPDQLTRATALYQVGTTSVECPKFSSAWVISIGSSFNLWISLRVRGYRQYNPSQQRRTLSNGLLESFLLALWDLKCKAPPLPEEAPPPLPPDAPPEWRS